jgi:Family of unknown function (DUF5519)
MFKFIVRYLGFLKHIPVVPHVYDALLKIKLFFFNRKLLDNLDDIEETVLSWGGTSVTLHKYGGAQFNLHAQEIGHLHGNGLLDVLLTRTIKEELIREHPIENHHVFKNSGWISFWIKTPADKDLAIEVLQQAYAFHLNRKY